MQDIIKDEARFFAIEYMLISLYVHLHRIVGSKHADVRRAHADFRKMMATETFPEMEPVESDAFSAEVQLTVERVQAGVESLLGMANKL